MKPIHSERGQALIILALAAIGIFGIVGLAIDGSAKFSDRRHAQNAADSAALAGALALVNEDTTWVLDALNRALE
ncbi:MAG TPA: pilus assembly protein TadG-related protein, partial [Anaerolineales bacterium]|nr:pilus assembly protein TadG-related protein [Anaerolineales bacterium]